MNFKKIMLILLLIAIIGVVIVLAFNGRNDNNKDNGKMNVVVTSFSAYDFVKQIAEDKVNVTFLLGPETDSHAYTPTAQELNTIKNADLFIYVGGEMESWATDVLASQDMKDTKIVKLMEFVNILEEQEIDGTEHSEDHNHDEEHDNNEVEHDEHIWSSPANGIIIVKKIAEVLSELDGGNSESYQTNADRYVSEIKEVQAAIQEIVDNKARDRLVFGDKMPMLYFLNEFGLEATAAFSGCSTETDASIATIKYIVDKVKGEKIPVVLYIELSNGNAARTIAEETGAEMMQIHTLHNVSREDYNKGETYVSLMTRNLEVLKKALQ